MSAPDTRESGAWRSDVQQDNFVTHSYRSVTQPEAKERLDYLKALVSDLRQDLEFGENAIRYIFNCHDNNMSEASGEEGMNLLRSIAENVADTKSRMTNVEQEIGSLSVNFDRLSTRMENTEHHLGLRPSAETMPVPTCKPRRIDRTFATLQLQQ